MSVIPFIMSTNNKLYNIFFTAVDLEDYSIILKNKFQILHPNETAYFQTLKYEKRQISYLVGRYACKTVLSYYLNERNLTAIEIVQGIFGHPIVRYLTREMPGISLSHDNFSAVAIAFPDTQPMALDIETADKSKVEIIKSQLTAEEISFTLSGLLQEYLLCTLFWTAKEALSKLIKCGLNINFTLLEAKIAESDCPLKEFYITYKNFPQYQACAWILENRVLTIAYPSKSEIDLNYKDISYFYNKNKAVSISYG